jgi:hypothetical protein
MADAVDDGRVSIGGRSYAVRPEVVDALRKWPSFYRAGTIGPDGFPDLTYGQSVIHPDRTGAWLAYLLRQAWAAQSDGSYNADEKGQILAFAYGFLTHAAGDVWAHTLINDFAQGVFPEAKEIVTSVPKAAIALRHIIVEGYVGDATPGFDGNPERTTLPGGDVSDDSTPTLTMNAPVRWLHRTLVDPRQPLPTGGCGNGKDDDNDGLADDGCYGSAPFTRGKPEQQRGPLIDYFLDLQSDLQLKQAMLRTDMNHANCSLIADSDCKRRVKDVWVDTVRGKRHGQVAIKRCEAKYFCYGRDLADLADDKLLSKAWMAYLNNWVDDIESGLHAWGKLGLATTRGLFDPQARRNLQNEECGKYPEGEARAQCETGVGVVDVVLHQSRSFITDHLLSMLGAPDATGAVLKALKALSELIDSLLPYNPLKVAVAELEKKAKELILKELRKVVGIDLATLDHMLKNPSVWLETEQIQLDLGPSLGRRTVNLFPPGTRARLDRILGLTEADRRTTTVPMPDGSTRTVGVLDDAAVVRNGAPIDNAITMSKLLLLDADGLNRALSDTLAGLGVVKPGVIARVYKDGAATPANVMVDGINGGDPWLRLIDGDHGWRQDGKPVFTGTAGHGGNGTFPLWESCLVRPAFQGALFRDWESGTSMFPALGDNPREDWADPAGPTAKIVIAAPKYKRPGKGKVLEPILFLGVGSLQLLASDAVFADGALKQRARLVVPDGWSHKNYGAFGEIPLPDTDGAGDSERKVVLSASDPCHDMAQKGVLSYTHDTRDPEVRISEPVGELVVDSADKIPLAWTIEDPGPWALASGIDPTRTFAVLDGMVVQDGDTFSTFGLAPGGHSLEIEAFDRVLNQGGDFRVFDVQATSASLLKNVAQGAGSQAFPSAEMRVVLEGLLTNAADAHAADDHVAEGDALSEARQMLSDQRGLGVAKWYADLMIAHIDDLVGRHIPPEG